MQTTQATADYIQFLSSRDGITHIVSSTTDANSSTLALTQKCLASGVDFPVPLPDGTVGINVPDGVPEKLLSFEVIVDAVTESEGRDSAPAAPVEEIEAETKDEEEDVSALSHSLEGEASDVTEDTQQPTEEPEMGAVEPAIEPQEDVGESVDEALLEETGLDEGQDPNHIAPVENEDAALSEIDTAPSDPSGELEALDAPEPEQAPSVGEEPAALEMGEEPVVSEVGETAEIQEDTQEHIQPVDGASVPETDLESEPEEAKDLPMEAELQEPPQETEAQVEMPVAAELPEEQTSLIGPPEEAGIEDEPPTDPSVDETAGEDVSDAPQAVSAEMTEDPVSSDAMPQDEIENTAPDATAPPNTDELDEKLNRILADQTRMFDLLADIQRSVDRSLEKPAPQPDAKELNRGMARLLTVFSTALRSFEDALGTMAQSNPNEEDLGEGASIHSSTAPYIRTLATLQEIMAIQMSRFLEDRSKTGDAGLNEMILDIKQTMAELTAQKTEYERKQEAA